MAKKLAPQTELFDLSDIKQKMQELEAQHRAELLEKKNKMIAPLLEQAEKQRQVVADATAKLNEIEKMISSLTGVSTKRGGAVSSGRQRRSPEQLKETAQSVFDFIASKKAEGATGKEIAERFGKLAPSVVKFLQSQGMKVKTTGVKASMRYFNMIG